MLLMAITLLSIRVRREGEKDNICWVALRPEQNKFATENTGEFSRENDDIRFNVTDNIIRGLRAWKGLLQERMWFTML